MNYYNMQLSEPSNSMLKHARTSMLAYYHHVTSGAREDTDAMRFGRAMHLALLEPDEFRRTFLVLPPGKLTSTAAKLDWATRCLAAAELVADIDHTAAADEIRASICRVFSANGRTVVTDAEMATMQAQVRSLNLPCHRLARGILARGRHEVELHWTHGKLRPKAKVDGWDAESGLLYDLKSCDSATSDGFRRALHQYGYHYQAAYYARGLRAVGEEPNSMDFVLAEKSAPFHWNVVQCEASDIERADEHTERLLARIEKCLESGEWPGLMGDEPEIVGMRRSRDD